MNEQLLEAGWSDEQWSRVSSAVTEEAQRARVAAQMLPVVGPEDPAAVAFSDHALQVPPPFNPLGFTAGRLATNNIPNHPFTRIGVEVQLSASEMADPDLQAAMVKFRRAANIVARLEDAVVFNDRIAAGAPAAGVGGIPAVYRVTGGGPPAGQLVELGLVPLYNGVAQVTGTPPRLQVAVPGPFPPVPGPAVGQRVVQAIIQAMNRLEAQGQSGPFACALSSYFYQAVYVPNASFVAAKDRLLPILNGPLLRASAIPDTSLVFNAPNPYGVVVALGANQVAIRVGKDISVKFLYVSAEPRYVFRVSEKLGLRISDPEAIAVLTP